LKGRREKGRRREKENGSSRFTFEGWNLKSS